MFELYRKSQTVQYNWIRNHPVLWLTSNVAFAVVFIGFVEYKDRQTRNRLVPKIDQQEK